MVRISGGLYASLLALFCYSTQFLMMPTKVMGEAKFDAWLAVVLSGLYGLVIALLGMSIASAFSGKSLVQIARTAFGPWGGGAIGLLYSAYWYIILVLALRVFQDFILTLLLPGTPGWLVTGLIAAATLYAVWSGLEPSARIGYAAHLLAAFMILSLPIFLLREFSVLQLRPILYEGWLAVFRGAVPTLSFFGELVLVLTLVPRLASGVRPYPWTLSGVLGGTALLVLSTGLISLVFGPALPTRFIFPGFEVLSVVSVTESVERFQVVLVMVWITVAWAKLNLCLLAAAESSADALNLRRSQGMMILITVMAVAGSQIWPGVLQQMEEVGEPLIDQTLIWAPWVILALAALAVWLYRIRVRGQSDRAQC